MRIVNLENKDRKIVAEAGCFKVLEYVKDTSVSPGNATMEYFMSEMGVRRRQLIAELNGQTAVITQAGAMQWFAGDVQASTGIKGVGSLVGNLVKGAVTNESAVKPEYEGNGYLALEPTYKFIILEDIGEWGSGMTVEDGMFLACEDTVQNRVVGRSSVSSAILGGEGLFNLSLYGHGIAALESNVPRDELIEIELTDDELKIDGSMAMCWTSDLKFKVERTTKTLIGSAMSGEGLVNVYRGTGKVLMSPVALTDNLYDATNSITAKPGKPKNYSK
ncbi:MAG: AIM24 family protein [Lachnospiraceae bacterium]|nr:AIM24 family protein [Lachnospiraceae bacterium]